jgi:hypothetical protein
MGIIPVGRGHNGPSKGVSMLDHATTGAGSDGGWVDVVEAGTHAAGAFRCSQCNYGVTVRGALPVCPMCAGAVWEPAPWSPFAPRHPAK